MFVGPFYIGGPEGTSQRGYFHFPGLLMSGPGGWTFAGEVDEEYDGVMKGSEVEAVGEIPFGRLAAVSAEADLGDSLAQELVALDDDLGLARVGSDDGAVDEVVADQGAGPELPGEVVALEDLPVGASGPHEFEDAFDEG